VGICLFSLNYPLVAALHGYPEWLFGSALLPVQDYMISCLSLVSYATALWLHSEVFDLKKNMPRLHQLLLAAIGLNIVLQISIPLGFYGLAMQIEAGIFFIAAPILLITSWMLWRRKAIDINTLLLGLLPPIYVVSAGLALLSIHGVIPFHNGVYSTWQYALIIHIVTVLIIAVLRVRAENRTLVRKQQLARELQIEREASFHQRQFMGMVAHEFRTPLAILQAALENLRLCPATVTQSSRLDRMQRATTRLVQLTDNCLADARLSSRTCTPTGRMQRCCRSSIWPRRSWIFRLTIIWMSPLRGKLWVRTPLHRCCLLIAGYCVSPSPTCSTTR
jgi:signal transduction histidine kinase